MAARSSVGAIVIAVLCGSCGTAGDVLTPVPSKVAACPASRLCSQQCVDLQSDAHNCGACAHDCEGAACALGLCAATIVAPGRAASAAGALASDGSIVYWHDNAAQQITSLDLSKTDPSAVVASLANVFWISINQNTLAATTYQQVPTNHVISAPRAGGTPVTLADQPVTLEGVALDDTHAYFATDEIPENGSLWRVPLAGGIAETLVTSIKANLIALDADQVYFTSYGPGRVLKVPKIGGSVSVLADNQAGPWQVVISGGYALWTNHYGDSIMRAPIDGSAPPSPIIAGLQGPQAIAVEGSNIYFTTATDGTVMKMQRGGVPLALAVGQNWPKNIAVVGTRVVWVNTDGTVMSVPR